MNYRNIFTFYKDKYNLKTIIKFNKNFSCLGNYDIEKNQININRYTRPLNLSPYYNCEYTENCDLYVTRDFSKIILFILLHEIKHAIDVKKKIFNQYNYNQKPMYFELRTSKFAKKELKKWI